MLSRLIAAVFAMLAIIFGVGWEMTQGEIDYVVVGQYNVWSNDMQIARDLLRHNAGAANVRRAEVFAAEGGSAAAAGAALSTVAQPACSALGNLNFWVVNSFETAEAHFHAGAAKHLAAELTAILAHLPHHIDSVNQAAHLAPAIDRLTAALRSRLTG